MLLTTKHYFVCLSYFVFPYKIILSHKLLLNALARIAASCHRGPCCLGWACKKEMRLVNGITLPPSSGVGQHPQAEESNRRHTEHHKAIETVKK